MDLSAFAKDSFSAKDWVNGILQQNEAQSNPESHASGIVMKLQLAIFEISTSLENTSGMVVQNLPRILRDIEQLQNEVHHFQKKLHEVEKEVSKVDKETTKSLEYLVKLDAVKEKLKATSKALQEADNWTTLMTDIEELFESNDLTAISQRLDSLRQSLDLLSHVSDYGDRLLQLDGLRNRLEALASPYLVSAISAGDAEKTSRMVQVFSNMDRLEQLLHYYTKCRRGAILHQWKALFNSEEVNIIEVMNSFYDLLLTDLQEQTKWYNLVFHHHSMNSNNILLSIYSQVLSALDPNPLHHLDSLMKNSAASQGLFILQQLKSSSDRLAQGLEAHVRDSVSVSSEVLLHFAESLFQLFRFFISNKYQSLCYNYLTEQFAAVGQGERSEEITETIHLLKQNHSKINSLMESTFNGCLNLTQGCGLELLLQAWQQFLLIHLQHYKTLLDKLRDVPELGEDSLHVALSLLQTLGELIILLEDNDSIIAGYFQSTARKLKESYSTPLTRYQALYLEPEVLERLDHVFIELDKDAVFFCLKRVLKEALRLNTDIQLCISNILMRPIHEQMTCLGGVEWAGIINSSALAADLPQFGLAPMEYITQIGQYLMMLPQHLEPFVLEENKGLTRALSEQTFPHGQTELAHSPSDFLLGCVANASATLLGDTILRISTVNPKTAKQLASDIDYLGNIFEDLGLVLPGHLSEMTDLFRAAASSILSTDATLFASASKDKDLRLVASVRAMCKLPHPS